MQLNEINVRNKDIQHKILSQGVKSVFSRFHTNIAQVKNHSKDIKLTNERGNCFKLYGGEGRWLLLPELLRILFLVSKLHYMNCAFVTFRNSTNGVYNLKSISTGEYYDVYCHMTDIGTCGGGGWTLVMKLDGNKVKKGLQGLVFSEKV
jgi:hypothetical protein